MSADQNPSITCLPPDSATLRALTPEDRALLQVVLAEPGYTLIDLAALIKADLATLCARILAPDFQAALAAVRRTAESIAQTRALIHGPAAISALSTVCDPATDTSPAERRRAASLLMRHIHAPPAEPRALARAPQSAASTEPLDGHEPSAAGRAPEPVASAASSHPPDHTPPAPRPPAGPVPTTPEHTDPAASHHPTPARARDRPAARAA